MIENSSYTLRDSVIEPNYLSCFVKIEWLKSYQWKKKTTSISRVSKLKHIERDIFTLIDVMSVRVCLFKAI